MRLITASVLAEVVFAALFPESAIVFYAGLGIAALSLLILKREALVLLPLLVSMPIIARALMTLPIRLGALLAIAAFILLALSDIAARHRGAPIRFARLLFWYLSGVYVLFVLFFAAAEEGILHPAALLVFVVIIGALGSYAARFIARRQRGAEPHPIPPTVDALAVGLLLLEFVAAMTFLPLGPTFLGALATIMLWLLIRLVISARSRTLSFEKVLRLVGIAVIVSIAVVFPLLFI